MSEMSVKLKKAWKEGGTHPVTGNPYVEVRSGKTIVTVERIQSARPYFIGRRYCVHGSRISRDFETFYSPKGELHTNELPSEMVRTLARNG